MRTVLSLCLLAFASPVLADSVSGSCERDGKRLVFTDGIAFQDARDAQGVVTTTIYLTAKPLDRAALARCAECAAAPGESTFVSPRGDIVEAQRAATAAGWMEIAHTGGELDMATIVNIMYLAGDGTLTGLDGGNGRVEFTTKSASRMAGKVLTEAREAPMNETDMQCDVTFDLAVGWPKR
ncbi:MAG: hypothetical protein ACTHK2_11130 [Dokdonella sp.]|uniref:hypothetical protein n=1 Tax=Dokdonella sp. TaxID=2291710 RepID=UPI003F7D1264